MDPSLLSPLACFACVAAHLSFTKAAAQLHVSRAALSQSLKSLERQLGVQLLYRTTRSMSLTEEGKRLVSELQPALDTLDRAVRGLGQATTEPTGLIRVNTARMAARQLIEPQLDEFLTRYPKLSIELVLDDGLSNIIADGCDAGIRIGERLAEHVVAVPVSPRLEMAVVASPAYFARYGRPRTPSDLCKHNCITYRHHSGGSLFAWEFTESSSGREFSVEARGNLVTNDDESLLRAACQGLGLVQHIDLAVREQLNDGRLERVLRSWCPPFPGFYLYVPSRNISAKVRALRDFLVAKRNRRAPETARSSKPASTRRRSDR